MTGQANSDSLTWKMGRWVRALALISFGLPLAFCKGSSPQVSINVILISIDSLRADHVHAYGYPRKTTPTLDRLAHQGALFETVVAESSWTLPTHVSMLTGLTTLVHGVEEETKRLNPDLPTLASLLREQGYRTHGIYSVPFLDPIYGLGKGFDVYEGVIGEIAYADETAPQNIDGPGTSRDEVDINPLSHRTISSPDITRKAIEFLDQIGGDKFFLFLHYFDVHYDYIAPGELWREFDPNYQGTLSGKDFVRNPDIHPNMSPEDLQHLVALYDGEILFTDRHIGYLMDALEHHGLTDNTLVMVTSDHGEEFFEHGNSGHGRSLYDEVLKVPLILRLPGRIEPRTRIKEPVRQVQIMPTILSLAGLEHDAAADLSRLLDETGAFPPSPAVSRLVRNKGQNIRMSFRTDQYKFIVHQAGRKNTQTELLFDLKRDPGEQQPMIRRQAWGPHQRLERLEQMKADLSLLLKDGLTRRAELAPGGEEEVELPADLRERLRALGYLQ